jgi:hypothetical protein
MKQYTEQERHTDRASAFCPIACPVRTAGGALVSLAFDRESPVDAGDVTTIDTAITRFWSAKPFQHKAPHRARHSMRLEPYAGHFPFEAKRLGATRSGPPRALAKPLRERRVTGTLRLQCSRLTRFRSIAQRTARRIARMYNGQVGRFVLALLVAFLTLSVSGVSSLVVDEPCSGLELATGGQDDEGTCPPTCVTCGCCAQTAEPLAVVASDSPQTPAVQLIGFLSSLPKSDPQDILHVPKSVLA